MRRIATLAMKRTTLTLPKTQTHIALSYPSDRTTPSQLAAFAPFAQWLTRLDAELHAQRPPKTLVDSITVQDIDLFASGRIGFLKFLATARHVPEGATVPGIVFMRGGAAAVLLVLRPSHAAHDPLKPSHLDTDSYVVLTEQPRLAVPSLAMLELPAGMFDDETRRFAGKAAAEVREETGISVEDADLVDLTECAVGGAGYAGVYPSSGACDEFVRLFACVRHVPVAEIEALRGRQAGLREGGEFITLRVVKMSELWTSTRDMKATSALYLWDRLVNSGKMQELVDSKAQADDEEEK